MEARFRIREGGRVRGGRSAARPCDDGSLGLSLLSTTAPCPMEKPMKAPGALRSNDGDVMTRSTMSLEAHALDGERAKTVRIVMTDTLPGGSEMEVTLEPEQAANFAVSLRDVAKSAMAAGATDLDNATSAA